MTFPRHLDPVAQKGDVVEVDLGDEAVFGRVERMGALPAIDAETITVGANSSERDVELTNLELGDGWLAQYRPASLSDRLPDDVTLELDHGGKQAPMWTTQDQRGVVDNSVPVGTATDGTNAEVQDLSRLVELYVYEQQVPYVTVTNNSGSEVDVDLRFQGYKFSLGSAQPTQAPQAYCPASNVRSR